MQLWISKPSPIAKDSAVARLLLLALAAYAVRLGGRMPGVQLILLGAGYLGLTALFLGLRGQPLTWLRCLAAAVDVAAVLTFQLLLPASRPDAWLLYVFPILAAGASGPVPSLCAAGFALAAYLSYGSLPSGSLGFVSGTWSVAALLAVAASAIVLPSRWLTEGRDRRAWDEVDALRQRLRVEGLLSDACGEMMATFEPAAVWQTVVRTARQALGRGGETDDWPVEDEATDALLNGAERSSEEAAQLAQNQLIAAITQQLELVTWLTRENPDREAQAWSERLASFAAVALDRCERYLKLAAEEERLRTTWQNLPAAALLRDKSGNVVLANRAYGDLHVAGAIPEAPQTQELTAGDPPRTFVLLDAPAPADCRLTLFQDVTREREALRAKDELLSLVSHEIRGPLTSIHGFNQMMGRHLNVVQEQVRQLDRLVGDLMSASSLKTGQLSVSLQSVDLAELARSAAERFRGGHEGHSLRLDLGEVPPVQGDPSRLNQVLDNLLNNAAKYSPEGSEIELAAGVEHGEVVLSVRDHGIGISREHLPHVFERFYRAPGAEAHKVKGLGLGLSVVHDLVTAHGGRVWAESEGQGSGTAFHVAFPVR